ncbi:MAG TPA: radical SAM protein [Oligoflexia bacterium]|nr:radical SAM protein [Oligoflexia bacterium]HMR24358.1 radical SAM protein [Oligoflexia bacterium]
MPASIFNTSPTVIDTLRLSITGSCNLNCFYCKATGKNLDLTHNKQRITPSDVSKIVKMMGDLGVRKVLIKGGEPLLRKDAANFVKSSFAHKAIEDVRLFTNGTFLKAFGDALRKYGLRKVTLNLDSMHFAKFQKITGSDSLYRVLDGIEKVEKLNFTDIRINITLFDGINNDEIVQFARLIKDRRIHVCFMEYLPVNSEADAYKDRENRLGIVEAKKMIDSYQILTPISPLQNEDPVPTFIFKNSMGKISFVSKEFQQKSKLFPQLLLTQDGMLFDESDPNKRMDLLTELRKDPKSLKLRKAVEKFMTIKDEDDIEEVNVKATRKRKTASGARKTTSSKKSTSSKKAVKKLLTKSTAKKKTASSTKRKTTKSRSASISA